MELLSDYIVSIHAPREGCDANGIQIQVTPNLFQFTHPGRGATDTRRADGLIPDVSIHAPREGCDKQVVTEMTKEYGFNSRTPGGVRPMV